MADLDGRVLGLLGRSPRGARLAAEVGAELRCGRPELDASLRRLEAEGQVLVQDHPAPDPHLEEADLRVVSAVAPGEPRPDAEARALDAGNTVWNAWLREFLASHRCT
ncbi:MAG: hypothetical protein J2P40_06560 [Candidatus Dormibacteraeota bacterium]|nr:hypothetical protein [Candidatus Dormibacteraeota bacterium]MBO0760918.1 hypothetical protein [Candidatus Dormibacteraeota bacterium]